MQAHDAAPEGIVDAVFNLVESVQQRNESTKSEKNRRLPSTDAASRPSGFSAQGPLAEPSLHDAIMLLFCPTGQAELRKIGILAISTTWLLCMGLFSRFSNCPVPQ
jgi:hypothetical protein